MLMWTLYLLATHPDIQEKLNQEVVEVNKGQSPGLEQIKLMPYTEMVINESMRLFPPAWSLMVRQAREPMQLGANTLPKDSLMLIPMWIVHRNPDVFPNPLQFEPERFQGDWKKKYPRYAFFPFGGGPHVCLGAQLAMFEGQLMLPMMVQKFKYLDVPRPDLVLQPLLTLRPKDGLKLKVQKR
jgi:cytochrome P450